MDEDHLHEVIRREIYRVCNAVGENSAYSSGPYGTRKPHDDLLLTCRACQIDATELERAINAVRNAELHLKHVTNAVTTYLRRAADSKSLKPTEDDLT